MSQSPRHLRVIGLALAACALGACRDAAPERPIVVVISLYTLRADSLGAFCATLIQ